MAEETEVQEIDVDALISRIAVLEAAATVTAEKFAELEKQLAEIQATARKAASLLGIK